MIRSYDVLVAGEINPDLILTAPDLEIRFGQSELLVESADLTVGSSSVIFACGAARLGLRVAFIGVAGADLFGQYMLEQMHARGVDTSHVIVDPQQSTGISVILNRRVDRATISYLGAIAALRPEQVGDELLEQTRHLHVASYFLQDALRPGLPNVFRRARALGVSTSLDPNRDPAGRWEGLPELLSCVDVFLPNESEARDITNLARNEDALHELAERCACVAVKCGAAGAIGMSNAQFASARALPVQVVDTVGAGDTFDAGFLYGWLNEWPLHRCLRLGAVCGSLSTTAAGGVNAQPGLQQALDMMD